MIFHENQEAVSLSQAAVQYRLTTPTIEIIGTGGQGSANGKVTVPDGTAWRITFDTNKFTASVVPNSGTGTTTVSFRAHNNSQNPGGIVATNLIVGGKTVATSNLRIISKMA